MIRLEVADYCQFDCCDFEPDVVRSNKEWNYTSNECIVTDTIIRCEHAKRCESIKRYLARQAQEEVAPNA